MQGGILVPVPHILNIFDKLTASPVFLCWRSPFTVQSNSSFLALCLKRYTHILNFPWRAERNSAQNVLNFYVTFITIFDYLSSHICVCWMCMMWAWLFLSAGFYFLSWYLMGPWHEQLLGSFKSAVWFMVRVRNTKMIYGWFSGSLQATEDLLFSILPEHNANWLTAFALQADD